MILIKPLKKINHLSLPGKILTVGYMAILYSSSSFAAPPVAFFSNGCPNGYVCETSVVSDGMSQRKLIDSNGNMYFQVTIVDGAANNGGLFEYDSFVNGSNGNTLGGISAKLDITETGLNNLNYSTVLNLGWANDGSAAVGFSQTVTDNYQGVGFEQSFDYEQNQTTQGGITGYKYDLFQRVIDSSVLNGSNRGGEDIHTFVLRRAAGDYVSSGSASLGGGGRGGMRKAVLGSVSSNGTSSASTTTYQNAFVPDPAGYGTDGTSTGTIGDAQTAPGSGTVFGQEANPTFPDPFNGSQSNTLITTTVGDYNTSNRVNTSNTGLSTGDITSIGVASGADAPTSEVYVATGSSRGMGMGGGGGTDVPGGTVRWNTGDEVQVLWIGQSCPGCTVSGMGMGGGSSGSFSFQQYENLTNGDIAAARSIRSTSPLNWDTSTFGPEPSL